MRGLIILRHRSGAIERRCLAAVVVGVVDDVEDVADAREDGLPVAQLDLQGLVQDGPGEPLVLDEVHEELLEAAHPQRDLERARDDALAGRGAALLEHDSLTVLADAREAMRVSRVRPGVARDLVRRLHVRQRAAVEVEVETALLGLAPVHAVLVGELAVVAGVADLQPPADRIGRLRGDDADIHAQQVLDLPVDPGQPQADIGHLDVRRQAQVARAGAGRRRGGCPSRTCHRSRRGRGRARGGRAR